MAAKIYQTEPNGDGSFQCWWFCPGCKNSHAFTIGGTPEETKHRWTWNNSLEAPSFHPSLMCNRNTSSQCHTVVTDGVIHFQSDCWHELKAQNVPMQDWEGW